MMRKIIKMLNNKKGFTLIELIVVIAVLGILAAVALPRIGAVTSDAKVQADAANIKILQEAAETYYAKNGEFPSVVGDFKEFVPELPSPQDSSEKFYYNTDDNTVSKVAPPENKGFAIE